MQPVSFEKFEGPLDLLLSLLSKNEIDIYDIPILTITRQYMEYIYAADELNIDLASDFIVVAAQLIEIKSKMMLPPDENEEGEDEIDPRAELVNRLLEYKIYKMISSYIQERESGYISMFSKEPEYLPELKEDYSDIKISAQLVAEAMRVIFERHKIRVQNEITDYTLEREEVSVELMIEKITEKLETGKAVDFFSLFDGKYTKAYIVASFLAILEMMKLSLVEISQQKNFGNITIKRIA